VSSATTGLTPAPRYRLGLGFAAMLSLMLFLTGIGLWYMQASQKRLDLIVNNHMTKIELATRMRTAAQERTVSLQKMILLSDPFERDEQWMAFNSLATDFVIARTKLLEMNLTEEEQALIKRQGKSTGIAVPLQLEVADLISEGKMAEARNVLQKAIPAQDRVLDQLAKLYQLQEKMAETAVADARRNLQRARFAIILLSGATIVLGLYIGVVVTLRARKADIALHHEKERAQVTLQSIVEAVIRTNPTGHVEYLNPNAEKLTGWSNQEADGRKLLDVFHIIHDTTRQPAEDPVSTVVSQETVVYGGNDLVLVSKSGIEYAIQLTAAPIRDYSGIIAGMVLAFRDETELRALGRELTYQATHDAMTGLMNRGEFDRKLHHALESARTSGVESALCYLDLDHFKVVNDICGHLAGDELLKQLSVLLKNKIRRGDVVARLGGDEFTILLHGCSLERAAEIAEEVRRVIRDFRFVWADKSFEVGVSIGVVRIAADSGDANDVYRAADVACHIAKDEGRNQTHVSRPTDVTVTQRKGEINWVQRINRAISENHFVLYGQRILPLKEDPRAIIRPHCEVLLRLREPNGEIVSPAAFLPAAERYHMMPAVDRWVIRTAFAMLGKEKKYTANNKYRININLSGQSLCDPEFLRFVTQQLDESGFPPQSVCFEITETAAVTNISRAIQLITTLKDAGCCFALDDFGSGLSSFAYLKNMKVDYLKIDGAFIRDIVADRADHAMVNSINQVAHTMSIATIAEYVENNKIRAALKKLGVDYVQGFAISRPAPLEEALNTELDAPVPIKIVKLAG